ncbi:MAG: PEP-CTERM sorting domain-containing protein [Fimbriimonadaceae bacterium]|nr:PEP-CTERM sorting domain-containing protein [Fimbriimonadaceae bacterium]QYK55836.1 MAG: PEP-CTERM sorting domain-containing protein [Fimbriimonadaceae bacterium]
MNKFAIIALTSLGASFAMAGSITTTFAGGNNGASLWTNYFDANVTNANGLLVTDLVVNTLEAGASFRVDVYTRVGTYNGNERNGGAGWSLVSSGTGISNGNGSNLGGLQSPVDVSDFVLGPGLTGIAIRYTGASPVYSNGNGSNQNYSNADLALTLGSAASTTVAPFDPGSGLFTPRVWNGTINYQVVPEPATMVALGAGLAALVARRRSK